MRMRPNGLEQSMPSRSLVYLMSLTPPASDPLHYVSSFQIEHADRADTHWKACSCTGRYTIEQDMGVGFKIHENKKFQIGSYFILSATTSFGLLHDILCQNHAYYEGSCWC